MRATASRTSRARWRPSEAIKRARRYGVAFCGVTNSHHFGAAGYHLAPIAEARLIGIAFTNSPAAINAWGGKRAFYGTNPDRGDFPRRGTRLVIDLSLTEVVRGKIMLYAKEGKPIPSAGRSTETASRRPTRRRRSPAAFRRSAA